MSSGPVTGIVLSGGGARGAYEAGVVAGITEILGARKPGAAPFHVFSGTSVGAVNAAWLAAHADEPDMCVGGLLDNWRRLVVDTHARVDLPSLLGLRDLVPSVALRFGVDMARERWGRALLDSRPLEAMVRDRIPWIRLHDNVARGTVRGLVVAALQIATGRSTLFAELAPGVTFRPSLDPRRVSQPGPLGPEHVLASSAIPFLFPSRRIGRVHYCDGGLRFNTPIAPAIRCGAERLLVVSLLHRPRFGERSATAAAREAAYPSPMFLLGKVLNALLLDPVDYDLQVLGRFNQLAATLERVLEPHELAEVGRVLAEARGIPYRRIETLVFRPTVDIGKLAGERARHMSVRRTSSWLLAQLSRLGTHLEADLLSFILFDGTFADQLIGLGRRDAHDRAEEVLRFFLGSSADGPN